MHSQSTLQRKLKRRIAEIVRRPTGKKELLAPHHLGVVGSPLTRRRRLIAALEAALKRPGQRIVGGPQQMSLGPDVPLRRVVVVADVRVRIGGRESRMVGEVGRLRLGDVVGRGEVRRLEVGVRSVAQSVRVGERRSVDYGSRSGSLQLIQSSVRSDEISSVLRAKNVYTSSRRKININ